MKEIPKEETKAAAPKPAETEEVTFLLSLFFVMLIFLYVQNYFKKKSSAPVGGEGRSESRY